MSKPAKERNQNERANFLARISQYTASQLVFSDESVYDKRTLSRKYGWNISGRRAQKPSFFIRGKRYTIEGALCINGFLAYGIQEGPMTSQDYQYFVETILVCMLLQDIYKICIKLNYLSNINIYFISFQR